MALSTYKGTPPPLLQPLVGETNIVTPQWSLWFSAKQVVEGSQLLAWVPVGTIWARVDDQTVTCEGDETEAFPVGAAVKILASSNVRATVTGVSYDSGTDLTTLIVVTDTGLVPVGISQVRLGVVTSAKMV